MIAQKNLNISSFACYVDNLDGRVDFLLRRKREANSKENVRLSGLYETKIIRIQKRRTETL
jgi:hypothetical protein